MSAGDPDQPTLREDMVIDVRRGAATEEELAALIAVVTEAYAEEEASATVDAPTGLSPWGFSQRSLRAPLRREVPWGRFSE